MAPPKPHGWLSRPRIVALSALAFVLLLVASFALTRALADTLGTITTQDLKQQVDTYVPTASVQDLFSTDGDLRGTVTTYQGTAGGSYAAGAGPTWENDTGGPCTNPNRCFVKSLGSANRGGTNKNIRTILVPWLNRKMTASVDLGTITHSRTNSGIALLSNSGGTTYAFCKLYQAASTGVTYKVFCGDDGTDSVSGAEIQGAEFTLSITYDPTLGAGLKFAGTVTCTAGCGAPTTSSAAFDPASTSGTYAGLFSGQGSTTQFDNFTLSYA